MRSYYQILAMVPMVAHPVIGVSPVSCGDEAVLALLRKEGAPSLRADFPLDQFASVRRLEIVAPVASVCTFRLVLVRDRFLRHLGLCDRTIQPEAMDGRGTSRISRHALEQSTS